MKTNRALGLIRKERLRQVTLWGSVHHTPIEYIALLAEELGEASRHAHEMHWNGKYYEVDTEEKKPLFVEEIIQVAALCVAAIESIEV